MLRLHIKVDYFLFLFVAVGIAFTLRLRMPTPPSPAGVPAHFEYKTVTGYFQHDDESTAGFKAVSSPIISKLFRYLLNKN